MSSSMSYIVSAFIVQAGELAAAVREQLQLPSDAEHELSLWFDGNPLLNHMNLRSAGVSLESTIFGWIEVRRPSAIVAPCDKITLLLPFLRSSTLDMWLRFA